MAGAGYVEHFGMKAAPFAPTLDPKYAYATRAHEIELLRIQDAVEQGLGLCLLTGQIGTGKSTIAHLLLRAWGAEPEKFTIAYISNPSLKTPAQFMRKLLAAYGLEPSRYLEANNEILLGFLLDQYEEGKAVVAMFDEAQTISSQNMHTLHALTNLQTMTAKLLQICLLAQPSMDRRLSHQAALNSRIARRGVLNSLLYEDAMELLRHRVTVAGGDFDRLFDVQSLRLLYSASSGLPRHLCFLADNALFTAFCARKRRVEAVDVDTAIQSCKFTIEEDTTSA